MFMDGSPQLCDEDAAVHQTTNMVQMTRTKDKEGFIHDCLHEYVFIIAWHLVGHGSRSNVFQSFNLSK
jgi:hypothetical protein